MRYRDIIFVQGDTADDILEMIDDDLDSALDYLLEREGEGNGAVSDYPPFGRRDSVHYRETADGRRFVMSWHTGLSYVGLVALEREDDDDVTAACTDCGRPTHYSGRREDYRHDDPTVACFLIQSDY